MLKKIIMFSLSLNSFANASPAPNIAMEKDILSYVNNYRTKHHLSPLTMNEKIAQEARNHSEEMALHKIPFGHQDFDKRIQRLFKKITPSHGGAENVAYAYKNAEDVVKNWLTSSGHRHNIEGSYNLTGIGVVRDSKGKIYFTQIFLRT